MQLEQKSLSESYELLDQLGKGGFGEVFKARQRATGQLVAIKKLLLPAGATPEQLDEQKRRFDREMKLLSRLRSAHFVKLVDAGVFAEDGSPFMALEFVEGRPLSNAIEASGAMPPGLASQVISQVLMGLAEAHDLGIVHRDLKPDNIMLIGEGHRLQAKVLDFGIAGVENAHKELDHETITQFGQIRGTPHYMAPEQFQFFEDARVENDIYAIGLIFLECLTGQRAVTGASLKEIAMRQINEPVEIPESMRDSAFGAIIAKATSKDPSERYSSADAMLQAIKEAEHSGINPAVSGLHSGLHAARISSVNSNSAPTLALDDLKPRPSRAPLFIALALLVVGGVVAALVLTGSDSGNTGGSTASASEGGGTGSPPTDETPPPDEAVVPPPETTAPPTETETTSPDGEDETATVDTAAAINEALVAAFSAQRRGDHSAARTAFKHVLALDPEHIDAREGLGEAQLVLGDFGGAIATFEPLLDREDAPVRAAHALFRTAQARAELDEKVEAIADLKAYLEAHPKGADASAARELLKGLEPRERRKKKRKDDEGKDDEDEDKKDSSGGKVKGAEVPIF